MKRNGFSLIELMIAVAILGILAAIAIPSYMNYTRSANRTDATRSLTIEAQALERCYSQAFSYLGCVAAPVGSAASAQNYYTVTLTVPAAGTSYLITATPARSPQTGDAGCAQFTLDSGGTQGASTSGGANSTVACWGST